MNKNVSLDIFGYTNSLYHRMKKNYDFAFSNNTLERGRVHPILCRFGVFHNNFKLVFSEESIFPTDPLHSIFFQQVMGNVNIIYSDKEWCYPNNQINLERAHSSLSSIETSLGNYQKSISLLGKYCLQDKTVEFDLIHFLKNISCLSYYNYAYPNDHYSEPNAHPSFQMLLSLVTNVDSIISFVKTSDVQLQEIITTMHDKLTIITDNLNVVYPNNNFNNSLGHTSLSKFLHSWTNFKETSLNSLSNYFDRKNLIMNYENQLKNQGVINTPSVDTVTIAEVEKTEDVDTPSVVKKFKSLL